MDKTIETGIPNVYISDLERLVEKIRKVVGEEDAEVSFELIIASLFPTSWSNIQETLSRQYTRGYIQGRNDKIQEIRNLHGDYIDDDPDCYYE